MTVLRPDRIHPNDLNVRHFVTSYAQQKNFQMVNLAKPGTTNFHISLQIDRAIQNQADYVIISATSPDRIDISLKDEYLIKLPLTVDQVIYKGYGTAGMLHINQDSPFIVSDSFSNLLRHDYTNITPEQKKAIEDYIKSLHNHMLQLQKDTLIIESGLHRLMRAGIDFVFMPGPLHESDWSWLGDKLWTEAQPWDLPLGFQDRNINHNPPEAHEMFLSTLNKMTVQWH